MEGLGSRRHCRSRCAPRDMRSRTTAHTNSTRLTIIPTSSFRWPAPWHSGSGVGASVAANRIPGVRTGLMHDVFSAHQGVEDDDMNVLCLGGKVIGSALALELVETFLYAHFSKAPGHQSRLA